MLACICYRAYKNQSCENKLLRVIFLLISSALNVISHYPYSPMRVSLTVFSINGTTTFQCVVHTVTNITSYSEHGITTVIDGMYVPMCITL